MKFDLSDTMFDLDGVSVVRRAAHGEIPMTMDYAVRAALVAAPSQAITPEESLQRFELQMRVAETETSVELTASEIVLIQNALAANFGPLVTGAIMCRLKSPIA